MRAAVAFTICVSGFARHGLRSGVLPSPFVGSASRGVACLPSWPRALRALSLTSSSSCLSTQYLCDYTGLRRKPLREVCSCRLSSSPCARGGACARRKAVHIRRCCAPSSGGLGNYVVATRAYVARGWDSPPGSRHIVCTPSLCEPFPREGPMSVVSSLVHSRDSGNLVRVLSFFVF